MHSPVQATMTHVNAAPIPCCQLGHKAHQHPHATTERKVVLGFPPCGHTINHVASYCSRWTMHCAASQNCTAHATKTSSAHTLEYHHGARHAMVGTTCPTRKKQCGKKKERKSKTCTRCLVYAPYKTPPPLMAVEQPAGILLTPRQPTAQRKKRALRFSW
jgi:hypothetical protein